MIEQTEFPFQNAKINSDKTGIYIIEIVLIILLAITVTVFIKKSNNTLQPDNTK